MSSYPACTSACLLFIVCLSAGILSAHAYVADERNSDMILVNSTPKDSGPLYISKPGIYSLNSELSCLNCSSLIHITSDDVILEGTGGILNGSSGFAHPVCGLRVDNDGIKLHNITIRNLTVTGCGTGIFMDHVEDVRIEGCTVKNNIQTGIRIVNGTGLILTGTEVSYTIPDEDESGGAGIQITDSDSVAIRSGIIQGNGQGDDGSGLSITRSSRVTIDETTITENAASGVITRGPVSGLLISKNIISSNNMNGISLGAGCEGPQMSGNRIFENSIAGMEIISSDHGFLTGNIIEDNRIGVSLSESEQFSLTANEIKGNSLNFDVTGSSPAMFFHMIDISNTADGRPIWYLLNSSQVTIGPRENPACIYAVHSSGITISDLILSKSGTGIFLINSGDITISRIAALDNAFGIRIGYGSQSISVSGCSAEKNLIAGYAVTASDNVTFSSCSAQNNLAGFLYTGSTNITCNACSAYKQQGIRRRGPSGYQISDSRQISIINSTADYNQFDGIYLKNSPDTLITGNVLSFNDIAGIAIISEGAVIRKNTVFSNKAGGILMYGNTSSLYQNKIIANKGRGLLIDGSTGNRIWDNFFNNTKNIEITGGNSGNIWNTTPEPGEAITGKSPTGGNYWGSPGSSGFSNICSPGGDGFCSARYIPGPNNTDYHPLVYPGYMAEAAGNISSSVTPDIERDINRNGLIELQDVVALMEKITSGNYSGAGYDFSLDGRINLQDVIVLFDMMQEK
jgi:parallel beta-helix repeat protein